MPDALILIRSGATEYDLQGRIRGAVDLPLSPAGAEEAQRAAERLRATRPGALYTSGDRCAVETGRILAAAVELRPKVVPHLRNLDFGLWQGLLVEEIRRRQPKLYRQWQDNPWAIAPPQGELLEEACERVEFGLEKILRRRGGGSLALVVPAPLDRIVRWILAGESMGDLWNRDDRGDPLSIVPLADQWRTAPRRRTGRGQAAAI